MGSGASQENGSYNQRVIEQMDKQIGQQQGSEYCKDHPNGGVKCAACQRAGSNRLLTQIALTNIKGQEYVGSHTYSKEEIQNKVQELEQTIRNAQAAFRRFEEEFNKQDQQQEPQYCDEHPQGGVKCAQCMNAGNKQVLTQIAIAEIKGQPFPSAHTFSQQAIDNKCQEIIKNISQAMTSETNPDAILEFEQKFLQSQQTESAQYCPKHPNGGVKCASCMRASNNATLTPVAIAQIKGQPFLGQHPYSQEEIDARVQEILQQITQQQA
mmetsp:Transcript_17401/g.38014  ORF Transcript_17401/g.38014 Transcript_17401/m.38014 type:complete len:268 (-) Transcript_17401:55-858(-)